MNPADSNPPKDHSGNEQRDSRSDESSSDESSSDNPRSGESSSGDQLHEYFTALLARHYMSMMSYTLSVIPNWSDAEDVLQQASVVMWRKFAEFALGSDFLSWGCQIARYQALNYVRKQTRDRHVFSLELLETLASEGAADADRWEAERHALRSCLAKLSAEQSNLLAACYSPGATIQHVAKALGRTPNSVYKGLNRIRESLLRCIRKTLAREGK